MKWMNKCVQRLKENRGFTIAELLVTTIILMLAMMLVTQSIDAGTRQFFQRTQHSEADILLGSISNYLQDELTYATDVELSTDEKSIISYSSPKVGDGAVLGIMQDTTADGSPLFSRVTNTIDKHGKLAVDATYYQDLRGTEENTDFYYYPISESSYTINSGSYGKLDAAISVEVSGTTTNKAGKKLPKGYTVKVQVYGTGQDQVLAENTFFVGSSVEVSAASINDVVINLKKWTVTLDLSAAGPDYSFSDTQWTSIGGDKYTREVDSEIGTVKLPASVGLSVSRNRTHTFSGWRYDAAGVPTQVNPGTSISVDSDMTVSVSITEKTKQAFVLYYGRELEAHLPIEAYAGEKLGDLLEVQSAISSAAVNGKRLNGWYTTEDGTPTGTRKDEFAVDLKDFEVPYGNDSSVNLFADYETIPYFIYLENYYEGTGKDTTSRELRYEYGDEIDFSDIITNKNRDIADIHQQLIRWEWGDKTYKPDLSDFDIKTMPDENITLKAIWADQFIITLQDGTDTVEYYVTSTGYVGGKEATSIADFAGYGTNTTSYTAPTRSGYDFQGWYNAKSQYATKYLGTDVIGTAESDVGLFAITDNLTLFAGYTRKAYYKQVSSFSDGKTYLIVGGSSGVRKVLKNDLSEVSVSVSTYNGDNVIEYSDSLSSAEWTAERYSDYSYYYYLASGGKYLGFNSSTYKGNTTYTKAMKDNKEYTYAWAYYSNNGNRYLDNYWYYCYLIYNSSFNVLGSNSNSSVYIFEKVPAETTVVFN